MTYHHICYFAGRETGDIMESYQNDREARLGASRILAARPDIDMITTKDNTMRAIGTAIR